MMVWRTPLRVWQQRGMAMLAAYVILAQALFTSIATGVHAGGSSTLPALAMVLCSGEGIPGGGAAPDHDRAGDCLARCAAAMQMPVPIVAGTAVQMVTPGPFEFVVSFWQSQTPLTPRHSQAFGPRAPPAILTFA